MKLAFAVVCAGCLAAARAGGNAPTAYARMNHSKLLPAWWSADDAFVFWQVAAFHMGKSPSSPYTERQGA